MATSNLSLSLSALTEMASVRSFPRFRSRRRSIRARSLEPGDGDVDNDSSSNSNLFFKDDDATRYVLKLGVGSVAGGAIIKYGSILVPQVTRPNLAEAMFIITTPVIVATLILLFLTKSRTTTTPHE